VLSVRDILDVLHGGNLDDVACRLQLLVRHVAQADVVDNTGVLEFSERGDRHLESPVLVDAVVLVESMLAV
jgi:hypothetical protein